MNIRLTFSLLFCFWFPFLGPGSSVIQAQIDIPEPYTLANGLKVFVVENRKLPQVSFSLHVNYDPVPEGSKIGTLQLLGKMLESGTDSLTQDSAWKEIEFWGAEVFFHSRGFTALSLSRYTPNLFQILAQMVTSPAFTEEELAKRKKKMLATLTMENAIPSLIRDRVGKTVTYGSDHPFGELPTSKTLKDISVKDIQQAYDNYFQPGISHLVVVGDVRAEEVWEWAEKHFGNWSGKALPTHSLRSPAPPDRLEIAFVHVPGEYQTYFNITNPILLRRGDKDEFGALVANYSLGMSFFDSHLQRNKYAGEFSIKGQEFSYEVVEAIEKILSEMKKLRTDSLKSVKLEFAKSQLIDRFDLQKTTPVHIGEFAHILETNSLPQEYIKHYTKYLEAVTAEDVLQAAQKCIKPEQAYIVVISSDTTLSKKLSQLGNVTDYDPSANLRMYLGKSRFRKVLNPKPSSIATLGKSEGNPP